MLFTVSVLLQPFGWVDKGLAGNVVSSLLKLKEQEDNVHTFAGTLCKYVWLRLSYTIMPTRVSYCWHCWRRIQDKTYNKSPECPAKLCWTVVRALTYSSRSKFNWRKLTSVYVSTVKDWTRLTAGLTDYLQGLVNQIQFWSSMLHRR